MKDNKNTQNVELIKEGKLDDDLLDEVSGGLYEHSSEYNASRKSRPIELIMFPKEPKGGS